ncbi:MAG: hypothetical protein JXB07_17455 [Anaerolineae bacterium]|nr:hypothetical protein [Anaerolineae bacterium]
MVLKIGSGIFWTLTYILIIRRGSVDKTYGMPIVALCANIAWEFIFAFVHPHQPPQLYVDIIWFLFDCVIVYQALHFGKTALKGFLPGRYFYPAFVLSLILSVALILGITYEFQDWYGRFAAFGQNLMMSVMFVTMLLRRNDVSGQSIYIALFKMIGTILPSILFYSFFPTSFLLNTLYIAIVIFDVIYLVLLYNKHKKMGINPWKRFW